jgi:hypothetical protein
MSKNSGLYLHSECHGLAAGTCTQNVTQQWLTLVLSTPQESHFGPEVTSLNFLQFTCTPSGTIRASRLKHMTALTPIPVHSSPYNNALGVSQHVTLAVQRLL